MCTETTESDRNSALAEVERDYPGWQCWTGVMGGLLYARYPRSSPPLVVRAVSTDQLRREIERAEAERGVR